MKQHIINQDEPLRVALERLNTLSGGVMTLLVVDRDGRMSGTLTDGDVRRALLAGTTLEARVADAMHRGFKWLSAGDVNPCDMQRYRCMGLRLIPVLDADRRVVRIVDTRTVRNLLPLSAILMAGGRGERLRPLTLTTPKPLLKVGDRAIIDYNVEALASVGVDDITVITNYLAEQIHDHFATPVGGVSVKCVREPEFLGTIGAVGLVDDDRQGNATIVMNSDLLTTVSFEDMYFRHMTCGNDITIGVIPYNVSVPFAILETDGDRVTALTEKPTYAYYANAGIYIISNELLSTLDGKTRMDAPDFITGMIGRGKRVGYFPINGTWIDIGSPLDFNHACELMRHHNQFSAGHDGK